MSPIHFARPFAGCVAPVVTLSGAYKDLVWLETTRSFGDIRLKAPHNIAPRVHGFDRIGIAPALSMSSHVNPPFKKEK